jgi:hypothetical protein
MSEADELQTILSGWVAKAEADLACAARLLKEREQWATEVICFHAQQCVEKYLKALLVLNRTDFPKTHDIRRLTGMLPPRLRPDLSEAERDTMTLYATVILLLRHTSSFEPSVIGHPFDAMGAVVQSSVPRREMGLRLGPAARDGAHTLSCGAPLSRAA